MFQAKKAESDFLAFFVLNLPKVQILFHNTYLLVYLKNNIVFVNLINSEEKSLNEAQKDRHGKFQGSTPF